ncbi:DUF6516 family protein [Halorutilales archaeon Cl-col2-1]
MEIDEEETPNRIEFPDGFVEYRFTSVPKSDRFPRGVKYGFQYVHDGTRILRYDNSHGVHERHYADLNDPEIIEWSGSVEEHLERFFEEVEEIRSRDDTEV